MALGPMDGGSGSAGYDTLATGSIDLSGSPGEFTDTGVGPSGDLIDLLYNFADPTAIGNSFTLGDEARGSAVAGYTIVLYWGESTSTWYIQHTPLPDAQTTLEWRLVSWP